MVGEGTELTWKQLWRICGTSEGGGWLNLYRTAQDLPSFSIFFLFFFFLFPHSILPHQHFTLESIVSITFLRSNQSNSGIRYKFFHSPEEGAVPWLLHPKARAIHSFPVLQFKVFAVILFHFCLKIQHKVCYQHSSIWSDSLLWAWSRTRTLVFTTLIHLSLRCWHQELLGGSQLLLPPQPYQLFPWSELAGIT